MLRLLLVLVFLLGIFEPIYSQELTPEIRKLHIRSDIGFRFATTRVHSQLANAQNEPLEAVFRVTLPKTAFMTNFSMKIDGETYYGNVKEKEKAREEYETAVSQGRSAGHVAATKRDSNKFEVSVNVAAEKKVNFELIYQEVLQRRLGHYEHVVNIDPGQIVPDLQVEVHINESRPIQDLFVPAIRKNSDSNTLTDKPNRHAIIETMAAHAVKVSYIPKKEVQEEHSERGIAGQFIVRYDVQRALDGGEILVVNGYFVHALAPEGLLPVPKNILFILDISGSMSGRKMMQMKDAMTAILDDLRHEDNFNLMTFDSRIRFWKNALMKVDEETITKGKRFIGNMNARGMTNINTALLRGIKFLGDQPADMTEQPSIIIFLTDGMPTVGEKRINKIISNIREQNQEEVAIFSLGFGNGVDINFLKQLSLQNGGVARKIYEASDAGVQLKTFYREVSIPLLSDVMIRYETRDGNVKKVTKHEFKTYFSGEEMIIAGQLNNEGVKECSVRPCLLGRASLGKINICRPWPPVISNSTTLPPGGVPTSSPWVPETGLAAYVERMWAYLTIKQLLDNRLKATNATVKENLKKEALDLSLQFKFVTPLTSMVVTRPNNSTRVGVLADSASNNVVYQSSATPQRRYQLQTAMRQSRQHSPPIYKSSGSVRPSYSQSSGPIFMVPASVGRPNSRSVRVNGKASNGKASRRAWFNSMRRSRPRPTTAPKRTRRPKTGRRYSKSKSNTRRRNRNRGRFSKQKTKSARRPRPRPQASDPDQARVRTTQEPVTPAPTLAPVSPSVKVVLTNGSVCLSWPRMKFSAHTLLHDQGIKIVASHNENARIQSVMIQTPHEAHVISLSSLLIGGSQLISWGNAFTGNNVTLSGNMAKVDLLEGLSMSVHKLRSDRLILEFTGIIEISDAADGLLKGATSWSLSNDRLHTNATQSFSTSTITRGNATCHVASSDIFTVTGVAARA